MGGFSESPLIIWTRLERSALVMRRSSGLAVTSALTRPLSLWESNLDFRSVQESAQINERFHLIEKPLALNITFDFVLVAFRTSPARWFLRGASRLCWLRFFKALLLYLTRQIFLQHLWLA